MENQTTDQTMIKMRLNKLVALIVMIVLGTNTVSLTIQRLSTLESRQHYDSDATKRRIENAKKELRLETEIKDLKKELESCK